MSGCVITLALVALTAPYQPAPWHEISSYTVQKPCAQAVEQVRSGECAQPIKLAFPWTEHGRYHAACAEGSHAMLLISGLPAGDEQGPVRCLPGAVLEHRIVPFGASGCLGNAYIR